MKCAKLVSPKTFETSEIDMPTSHDGRVVIKVEACGICGSDIHNYDIGEPSGLVMGHEISGTVVDPGDRVDLHVGDRVTSLPISPCGKCKACKTGNPQYCAATWTHALGLSLDNPGGYAEYTSFRSDMIRPLPKSVSFKEGAMVEPSAVSLHAVNLADIKVGDKVLVIGAGIIGLMACEFAKISGAGYIAVLEANKNRGKKATTVGKADEFFDATDPQIIEKLKTRTEGGFDVVIECCGNEAAVTEALMSVRQGGTVVLVGVSVKPVTLPLVVSVMGEQKVLGAIAYTESEFDACIDLIAKKRINVQKYIDKTVSLEEANEAFKILTDNTSDAIKILFTPNE